MLFTHCYFDIQTRMWVKVVSDENGKVISTEFVTDPNEYE